ncbi:MAG TPA: sulfatase [Candidatus Latescibacteria bacterium]|nr:sulfatase [Candidatus Handelsmanbacteria bacterium]HIL10766.1 sulfatase [Candidatus Latescibacterota bacterium]
MEKPNIVYIHSHDTGRYIAPYGHAIPTPNMQQLAENGVLFRQAFCANPTCSPSRASLLTGQWAHSCGMGGLVNRGWSLPHPERLLPRVLRQAGYQSVRAGFQHVVKDPLEGGYERILADGEHAEARAASFLAQAHERPFFLDVGFNATHRKGRGFDGPPEGELPTDPGYVRPPAPLADTAATREDMALYIDAARTLDRQMGHVFAALDEHGLRENTLVICTTDHGIAFPRMKCNLTDHGMGVMLIVRGPGGFTGGQVVDGLVSHIDLFPTICEIAGLQKPAWLQGISLCPLVGGEQAAVRTEVFAEVNYHVCYEPQRAVRTAGWKYIRRFHARSQPMLPNCDDSLSKDHLLAEGWRASEEAEERLYDLVGDPFETRNLAAESVHGATLADMRGRLQRWQQETDDPLLSEPFFMPPATAEVVDPDALSPKESTAMSARAFLGVE